MYGIILVLVLVATGGLVAFWGDRVGRRIGKKRLSLFGLRPRHTSVLITIITGILISTATLAILAMVSQDVRTALFGMKKLQASLAFSQSRLTTVSADLAQKSKQVQALSRSIEKKTEEYQQLSGKLLLVQQERDRVNAELDAVSGKYVQIKAEYQKIELAYNKTNAELTAAQRKAERLRSQLAPLASQVKSLGVEKDKLLKIKKTLELEIQQLNQERSQLQTGLENMVFGRVVYRADEIVLATVIDGRKGRKESQNDLSAFLTQANKVAIARGARVEGKQGVAIKLLEGNFDTAGDIIAKISDEVVVRLISMINVVEGEPVLTYFQILPKNKVWSAGQTIAACQINGGSSFEQIQLELMDFLYSINKLAISRGMVADAEGNVGDLSLDAYKTALKEIADAEDVVTVEAIAASDVWTTKLPLRLNLKISQ
jgi:uncharacterized protein (DUF3084 family)